MVVSSFPVYERGEGTISRILWSNYALPLHAILAVALAVSVVKAVDGIIVNPSDASRKSDGKTLLYASDVTTIISAAVVLVKLASTAWCTLSAWKCAFILLETTGLNLKQFNRMVSWKLPFKFTGNNSIIIAVILVLMFPSAFVAPLITGATGWQSAVTFRDGGFLPSVMTSAVSTNWYWYLYDNQEDRNDERAFSATGIASDTWANIGTTPGYRCRHMVNEKMMDGRTPVPVNSTLENAVIPCIKIHSLIWDELPWPEDVLDLWQSHSKSVSLAGSNPVSTSFWSAGNTVLYDFKRWDSQALYGGRAPADTLFPPPALFSGTKKILLLINRQQSNNCTRIAPSLFGNATSMDQIKNAYPLNHNPTDENCYLSGTINITAGIVKSPLSRFVSSRVVEVLDDELPIEHSTWTEEALFQMPDVTGRVSKLNNSHVPTWDNMDNYVKAVVGISYMASWDSLYSNFDVRDPVNLKVNQHVNMLQASVSRNRVYAWLAINLLLTASGIMLIVITASCKRAMIADAPAAAIMTDTSKVKPEIRDALSGLSYVTKVDTKVGEFRLEGGDSPALVLLALNGDPVQDEYETRAGKILGEDV